MPAKRGASAVNGSNDDSSTPSKRVKRNDMFAPSPRKTMTPSSASKSKAKNQVIALGYSAELGCEVYMVVNGNRDMYYQGIVQYMRGDYAGQLHEMFDKAGFYKICSRRVPYSANETMMSGGYRRVVILRFPDNDEKASTTESRLEGMEALKSFLMDSRFSKYPPRDIELVDKTDDENLPSLDQFLTDEDIKEIMGDMFNEDVLNADFVDNFPSYAQYCWRGKNVSEWASSLGFPIQSSD
jgi:hypothetical protein